MSSAATTAGCLTPPPPLAVLAGTGIALQLFVHGGFVSGVRGRLFNDAFYEQASVKALTEEHKKATGEVRLPRGGYPDMGSGRYSALLDYKGWWDFNNAQRSHLNYVETAPSVLAFLAISATTCNPQWAAALGASYIIGREVYRVGYSSAGPQARLYGAVIFDIALLGLLGTSVYGGLRVARLLL